MKYLKSLFVAVAAVAMSAMYVHSQELSTCTLCNEGNVEIPLQFFAPVTMGFQTCCPNVAPEDNCVVSNTPERSVGFDKPIYDADSGLFDYCLDLSDFEFVTNEEELCCSTCRCHGDPNCISFSGVEDFWVVCDARQQRDNGKENSCYLDKDICLNTTDGVGEQCQWKPVGDNSIDTPRGYDPKSIKLFGSPCQPTACSDLLMYSVNPGNALPDIFRFEACQGERGFIQETTVTQGAPDTASYTLSAESCFTQRCSINAWTGSPSESLFVCEDYSEDTIIWYTDDLNTGIQSTIVCNRVTGEYDGESVSKTYLNVQAIKEPNSARGGVLNGFCATSDFGPNQPEDAVGDDSCTNGRAQEVEVARAVCQNPTLPKGDLVSKCWEDYCQEYSNPFYEDSVSGVQQCVDCFVTAQQNKDDEAFASCFCDTITELIPADVSTSGECSEMVSEQGWDEASNFYYNLEQKVEENCIPSFQELPDKLEDCEEGVVVQYYNEDTMEWVNYKAIPARTPLCKDAELNVCYNPESPEPTDVLFVNKIRFVQVEDRTCNDGCNQEVGFEVRAEIDFQSNSPSTSPSLSPTTPEPTPSPTPNPTTTDPTPSPTIPPVVVNPPAPPTTQPTLEVAPTPGPTTCVPALCDTYTDCTEVVYPRTSSTPSSQPTILEQMPLCCGPKDTDLCEGDEVDPNFEYERHTETCNELCPEDDPCCGGTLTEDDILKIQLNLQLDAGGEVCCPHCTVFGDPRGIDFEGRKQSWIPCDARVFNFIDENNPSTCELSEEVCVAQMDPHNQPCTWDSSVVGGDVGIVGSPCRASADSSLWVYNISGLFSARVWQGNRGIITSTDIFLGPTETKYSFQVDTCWDDVDDVNFEPALPDTVAISKVTDGADRIVLFIDTVSKIQFRMRCKANIQGGSRFNSRLSFEDLVDPLHFERPSNAMDGFCVTGDMGRTGSTSVTDSLDPEDKTNSACTQTQITQARTNKILCAPYVIGGEASEDCEETLCSLYAYPNYGSTYQEAYNNCLDQFRSGSFPDNYEAGVCKLFIDPSKENTAYQRCKQTIRDENDEDIGTIDNTGDLGWRNFEAQYLQNVNSLTCSTNPADFPNKLGMCQQGVEMQLLIDGEWEPYLAFPVYVSTVPLPCESGLIFNADDHPDVFKYKIRFEQGTISKTCTKSICTSTVGVAPEFEFDRSSQCV